MIPYKSVLGIGYILLGVATAIQLILPITLSYVYPFKPNITQLTTASIGAAGAGVFSLILFAFALILVSIGWIIFGRSANDNLWTVTGIVGILFIAFSIATLASLIYSLTLLSSMAIHKTAGAAHNITNISPTVMAKYLPLFIEVYILAILAIVFGATFTINQISSLWTAGSKFRAVSLKASAILQILSIVVSILLIPIFISTFFASASSILNYQALTGGSINIKSAASIVYPLGLASTLYWLMLLSNVLSMASYFIAGAAILTLKPKA